MKILILAATFLVSLQDYVRVEIKPEVRLVLLNRFVVLQDSGIKSEISDGVYNNHYNDPVENTGFKIRVIDF